jgi:ribosomal-protein-alanine N-acetyltransferase
MNTSGRLNDSLPFEEVVKFDQDHFPTPWNPEAWWGLDMSRHKLFTWHDSEKLLGFALFEVSPYDDSSHLYKILIHPVHQCQGHAKVFWSCIVVELKKLGRKSVYLEVNSGNLSAVRFYEKCGFVLLRKNKSYYTTGEDALVMTLTL